MKNKLTRKLFLSMFVLLFAVVSLATTTYAWFSNNKVVTATGITAQTSVESDLLIAADAKATSPAADSTFTTSLTTVADAVTIQPVSTTDGVSFFYTSSAAANGDALKDEYTALTDNTISDDVAGYIDYVVELKAINTSDSAKNVILTALNLTYTATDSESDANKAFRVAVFSQSSSAQGTAYSTFGTSADKIYAATGSSNFTTGKAVSSTTALGDVTYVSSADDALKLEVAANSTVYFKITFRLWIEGEDTTCNNQTFLLLNGSWVLDTEFAFSDADGKTAVTGITMK